MNCFTVVPALFWCAYGCGVRGGYEGCVVREEYSGCVNRRSIVGVSLGRGVVGVSREIGTSYGYVTLWGSLTDAKILMLCVVYLYSYRPTLSVDYIANILGFSSSSECVNFLAGCDAVMNDSQTAIDCKLTHDKMSK